MGPAPDVNDRHLSYNIINPSVLHWKVVGCNGINSILILLYINVDRKVLFLISLARYEHVRCLSLAK
jgi:hypothetical protein